MELQIGWKEVTCGQRPCETVFNIYAGLNKDGYARAHAILESEGRVLVMPVEHEGRLWAGCPACGTMHILRPVDSVDG